MTSHNHQKSLDCGLRWLLVLMLLCSAAGCSRYGFGNRRGDGGIIGDGAPTGDGVRIDGARGDGGDGSPPGDGGAFVDATPGGDGSSLGLCLTVGAAPETVPPHTGKLATMRPTHTMISFCLDAAAPAAKGDALCKQQLGSAYSWSNIGVAGPNSFRAALEVAEFVQGANIHLVGKPEDPGSGWQVAVATCNPKGSTTSCGGLALYGTACLPQKGVPSRLLCTRTRASAVTVATNTDAAGATLAGVYDPTRDRYAIVYMTDRGSGDVQLRFVSLHPYGKDIADDRLIAGTTATSPNLRLVYGQNAAGASRIVVAWERDETLGFATRRRIALLDASGAVLAGPIDPLGFDCYNADGQQALSYDSKRRRVLLVASGNAQGLTTPISMFGQFYDANTMNPIGARFEMTHGTTGGLFGHYMIYAAYDPKSDQHLVINRQDVFAIPATGPPATRSALGRELHGLTANRDAGGFLALGLDNSLPAAVRLDAQGKPLGGLRTWSSRKASFPTGDFRAGFGLRAHYIPQASPGWHRGRFWVRQGELSRALHATGESCFPADARAFDIPNTPSVTLIPNGKTGGFALLYVGTTSKELQARFYLSNGEPY